MLKTATAGTNGQFTGDATGEVHHATGRVLLRPTAMIDAGGEFSIDYEQVNTVTENIAAARDNEVSLDMPGKGGVATQAWRDCITGAAVDRDGSGGLSADEIRTCAQDRINVMLRPWFNHQWEEQAHMLPSYIREQYLPPVAKEKADGEDSHGELLPDEPSLPKYEE